MKCKTKLAPMSPTGRTGHKETQVWQNQQSKKGKRKTSKQDKSGGCQDAVREGKNQDYRIMKNPWKFSSLQDSKMHNSEAIFKLCAVVTRHRVSYFWLGVLCTQVTFSQYPNAQVAKMIKISWQTVKSMHKLLLVSEKENC